MARRGLARSGEVRRGEVGLASTDNRTFPDAVEPELFFTELPPCEACGRPASRREWNAEHQLMIGVGCVCNEPDEPMCPALEVAIAAARNVREIVQACKEHRAGCPLCSGEAAAQPQGPARARSAGSEEQPERKTA